MNKQALEDRSMHRVFSVWLFGTLFLAKMSDVSAPSSPASPTWTLPPPQIAIPATTLYRVCMVCNEPSRLRCSQCKRAFYCNACCQEQDWPAHSEVCEHWSASFGSLFTCTHNIDKQTSFILECAPAMSASSCASSIAKKKLSWK